MKKKIIGNNPLLTIVTVVYNCIDSIEETILSVINQGFSDFEYIIIDGGSTDGSLDLIKKYKDSIEVIISEKDNGIYDAMNKALKIRKGKWINFLNSGDTLFDENVLSKASLYFKDNKLDVIYGDVLFYDKERTYYHKSKTNKWKINFIALCHQSVFVKSKAHGEFSSKYKLAADYDIIYTLIKKGNSKYLNTCVSKYLIGGVSSDVKKVTKEKFFVILSKGNILDLLLGVLFFLYSLIKLFVKQVLIFVFPVKIFNSFREIKNKLEQI